ncbi:hypothetical protein [Streptococcus macacae]|uniref:Helix-hairpin-helix domain protein n=1 Tax=Streptococcus macacae NCTC 11558 TaxID=764298 RepID=G5JWS2_9STRE|nr:hypothetical protein [Streptococcus macacae]EHJ51664.1 hypothetical protein STRMA_1208 [Streptococcus macacae NCTC 11558]SUN79031.1 superfamily II helicase [Streptococcus macacae NCTC 11558]
MAKKKVNRKKRLKKQLADSRRANRQTAVHTAPKRAEARTVQNVEPKQQAEKSNDFESFAAELEGVAQARLETFFAEGIKSAKDFADWTEKELLTLKGIGPATIKQLREKGLSFKG